MSIWHEVSLRVRDGSDYNALSHVDPSIEPTSTHWTKIETGWLYRDYEEGLHIKPTGERGLLYVIYHAGKHTGTSFDDKSVYTNNGLLFYLGGTDVMWVWHNPRDGNVMWRGGLISGCRYSGVDLIMPAVYPGPIRRWQRST
jgi:hypothetical protein